MYAGIAPAGPPVGFGRDVGHRAGGLHLAPNGVAVVGLVGVQDAARGHPLQKQLPCRAVGDVTAGQHEGDRATEAIRQRVDLGRAPAARSTDGLRVLPPLAPEAER